MEDSQNTGNGCEETYVSKWFAYQDMLFLADKNKPRTTVDTEVLEEKNETVKRNEKDNENEEDKENKEVNEKKRINEETDVNQ
ncbi:hypothetical protein FQA39_LY16297 [Lamprigera yunnana]|nr:hypothetical protein FQA39_LY16297 [Lamprigera yunnana]